jgi:hypothetical protein
MKHFESDCDDAELLASAAAVEADVQQAVEDAMREHKRAGPKPNIDTVGEFPWEAIWLETGQDETCWQGESMVSRYPRRIRQQYQHSCHQGKSNGPKAVKLGR